MNLSMGKEDWRFKAFADCPALYTSQPPCWFHRVMQRLFFGFRWTRGG
jgi:hypothetical protein